MSTTMRVGVIGVGSWAVSCHLPALARIPDVEIVAVSRRDPDLLRDIARRFKVRVASVDWRDVIAERPDAVIIASPPVAHEEPVIAALEAGAAVLCEKPFALDLATARRMQEAAIRAKRPLLMSYPWNVSPVMSTGRRLWLEEGGSLEHAAISLSVATRALLLDGKPYNVASSMVPPRPSTYVDANVSGGGAAAVSMSHVFGLLAYMVGSTPSALYALTTNTPSGIDLHDAVAMQFDNDASGVVSVASAPESASRVDWHVSLFGTGGRLRIESTRDCVTFWKEDGKVLTPALATGAGASRPGRPVTELLRAARTGVVTPALDSSLGVASVALTEAVYRSTRSMAFEPVDRGIAS